jgi:hypothetical protein
MGQSEADDYSQRSPCVGRSELGTRRSPSAADRRPIGQCRNGPAIGGPPHCCQFCFTTSRYRCSSSWPCSLDSFSGPRGDVAENSRMPSCSCAGRGGGDDRCSDQEIKSLLVIQLPLPSPFHGGNTERWARRNRMVGFNWHVGSNPTLSAERAGDRPLPCRERDSNPLRRNVKDPNP